MYVNLKDICDIAFSFKNKEQRTHVLSLIEVLDLVYSVDINHRGKSRCPNYLIFRNFKSGNPSIDYCSSKTDFFYKATSDCSKLLTYLQCELEYRAKLLKAAFKDNKKLKNEIITIKEEKIFDYKSFNLSKLSVSELNDLSKKSSDLRADLIKEKPTDQLAIENGIDIDRYDTVRHGTVIVYKGTAKIKMANGSLWEAKGIPTDGCAECIFRRSYIDYRRLE